MFEQPWKNEQGRDKRKCPAHNMWMRKGQCELCRLRLEEIQRENERTGGSHKPPVKLTKPE
jgi:hypothetical protein